MSLRPPVPAPPAPARAAARALGVSTLALAAALAGMQPLPTLAGPDGGRVKRGEARIETRGNVTTIRQGGSKVVIDWKSFDVAADEVVRFLQPGRDATALNRVLDAAPSHIRGRLEANGNVWLINRHGVIFHQSSVVNVGGLLASTADITDDDFMAGNYDFSIPGAPGARVVNEGEINFADHGLVGLIGAHAENRGVIRGRVGQVVVGGAETYAVDLAGDGLFAFEFDEATTGVSAAQAGEIVNAGGEVLISAASADALVDNVVSVEGVVSADAPEGAGGSVTISAPGGEARIAGEVSARGGAGDGGRIDVRARDVAVEETATLDVSSGTGRGGEALVIAEEALVFSGLALARGFAGGGFVETSGATVRIDGRVSTGPGGRWLIDPTDIDIGGGDEDVTAAAARTAVQDGTGLTVETADAGAEDGTITVFGDVFAELDFDDGVTASFIELLADGQVVLAGSGGITRAAGDAGALSVRFVTDPGAGGIDQGAAPIALGAGSTLTLEGGAATALPAFTADALVLRDAGLVSLATTPESDGITFNSAEIAPLVGSGVSVTVESTGNNVRVIDGLDAISVDDGTTGALTLIAGDAGGNVNLVRRFDADGDLISDGSLGQSGAGTQGVLELTLEFGGALNFNAFRDGGGAPPSEPTLSVGRGSGLTLRKRGGLQIGGGGSDLDFARVESSIEDGARVTIEAVDTELDNGDVTMIDGPDDLSVAGGAAALTLIADDLLTFRNTGGSDTDGIVQTAGPGTLDVTLTAERFDFEAGEPITVLAGGSVAITGTNATDVALRNITAPTLSVSSGGGIVQAGVSDLDISGTATFTASGGGDVTLGDGDLGDGDGAQQNDFGTVVATTVTGDLAIDDVDGFALGNVSTVGLTVLSGGPVTQAAGTTVTVSGTATLTANGTGAGIALAEAGNAFATVVATAPNDAVSIRDDAGDLLLGDVEAGSLTVVAAGAVDQVTAGQQTGSALDVGGLVSISAGGPIDLDNTANAIGAAELLAAGFAVEVTDSDGALGLGGVAASTLTVRASGAVSQRAGTTIEVAALADLETTAGGVILDQPGNAFDTVRVSAPGNVEVDDDDGGITLDDVSGDAVTIRAQGDVVLSGTFAATGDALISAIAPAAPAPDIDLTGPGISFGSIGAEAVGGADRGEVRLASDVGITLGRITAGTLIVDASGSIDQLSGAANRIDVSGATTLNQNALTTESVTLAEPANDFATVDIVSAGALDTVSLADATAITVGPITVETALTVATAGGVQDSGVLIAPTATFRATDPGADVILDLGHDFGSVTLEAGGDVVVNDTDSALLAGLSLTEVDAGSLSITTPGVVSQPLAADGVGVVVAGETFIQQAGGVAVALQDVDNDFGSVRLGAAAPSVQLTDATGIALDGIQTPVLTVVAGGDVTDIGAIDVGALSVTTSGGGGVLLDAANAIGTATILASGGGVALRDADGFGLVLGDVRAASLAVLADGSISQAFGTSVGTAGDPVAEAEITAFAGVPQDVFLNGPNDFDRLSVIGDDVVVDDVDDLALVDSRAQRSLDVLVGGALELTRVSVDGIGGLVQSFTASGTSITATDLVTDVGTTSLTATNGDVSLSEFAVNGLDLSLNAAGSRTLLMRLGEVGDLGFSVPVVGELTLDGVVFAGGIRGGPFATPGLIQAVDLARVDRVRTPSTLTVVAGGVELGRIDAPSLAVTATGGAGISTFAGLVGDDAVGDRVASVAPGVPTPPATAGDGRTRPGAGQPTLDGGGVYSALVDVPGTTTLTATAPGATVALDQAVTVDLGGGPTTLENDFGTVQGAAAAGFALRDADGVRLGGVTLTAGAVTVEAATVALGSVGSTGAAIVADSADVTTTVAGSDVALDGPNDVNSLTATVAGTLLFRDRDDLSLGPITADAVTVDAATSLLGDLTQTGPVTTGTLVVSTTVGGSDVTLTAVNVVDRLEASAAGNLTFREADALELGPVSAGGAATLEAAVASAGDVTQTAPLSAGLLSVTTSEPGSAVTLEQANAIDALFADVTGALSVVDGFGGLDLSGVTAPSLDLSTPGALTQSGPVAVASAGNTELDAASILLTLAGNAFGSLVARTEDPDGVGGLPRGALSIAEDQGGDFARILGGAVSLDVAAGDVTLDDVDAESLSVSAGNGPILQTATGVTVTGASDFASVGPAFGVILETSAANDFGGRVDATADPGARVAFVDAVGDLVLGDLSGGEIVATATAGSVLHEAGATLAAGPGFAVRLTAAGDVVVEDVTGDAFEADAGGAFEQRAGTSLIDVDGLADVTAGTTADLGDVEAGDLSAVAAGDVAQRAGQSVLTVAGTATLESTGGSVTLEEGSAGDLIALAAEDVVQRAGAAGHDVSGSVTIEAGRDALLGDLSAATLDVTAGRDVTQQAGDSTVTVAGPAAIQAGEDVSFDRFSSDGLSALAIGGAVEQSAGGAVTVAGETALTAPSGGVALGVLDNDFDAVSAEAGGAGVLIADRDEIALGTVTGSVVEVRASGDVAQLAGASLAASGPATLESGAAVTVGNLSAFDLRVVAPAGVTQLADTSVDTVAGARIVSGGPVLLGTPDDALDPPANGFGDAFVVEATAPDVTVTVEADAMARFDAGPGSVAGASVGPVRLVVRNGGLTLGRVEAAELDVTLDGGAISQSVDGVVVEGVARFDTSAAPGSGIALDGSAANDFATLEAAAGADSDLTVADSSAVRPGVVDGRIVGLRLGPVSGNALSFVLAEGALVQAPGAAIMAETSTFVAATDAILTADGNRLGVFTGEVVDGFVEIESEGALVLADVAADDVMIRAGGSITQEPGTVLLFGRRTDVETILGDVTLTNPGNDFGALGGDDAALTGSAPGRVEIVDANDLVVDGLTAASVELRSLGGATAATNVASLGATRVEGATGARLVGSDVGGAADVVTELGRAELRRSTVTGDATVVSSLGDADLARTTVSEGDVTVRAAGLATLTTATVEAGDVTVRADGAATLDSVRAAAGDMDVRAGSVVIGGGDAPSRAVSVLAVARDGLLAIDGLRTDGAADLRSGGDIAANDLVMNRAGLAEETAVTPFGPSGAEPGSFAADLQARGRVVLSDVELRAGTFVIRGRGGAPRAGGEVAIDGLRVAGSAFVGATESGPGVGDPGALDPRALTVEGLVLGGVAVEPVEFGDDAGQTQALVSEDEGMSRIVADRNGLLHLLVGEAGRPGDVRIVSDGPLGLRVEPESALGDVEIAFDRGAAGPEDEARTLEIFDTLASADAPAGRITILDAHDVTVGRTTEAGVEGRSILSLDFEDDRAIDTNFLYAEALTLAGAEPGGPGVDGIVLLDRDFEVNEQFLEDTRYFGLVLTDNLVYFESPGLRGLDLAGSIAGSNLRAAGIEPDAGAVPSGPPPPESTDFLFNLCEIGNVTDCSSDPPPTARIDTPETEPPSLFVLDLAQLADVYASFGNEELWSAPPAFTVDLAEGGDDEDDDDEEDAQ